MIQNEYELILVDTSCLILLEKIEELRLLKSLFGVVTITSVIEFEYGLPLPDWIFLKNADNFPFGHFFAVDAGEASVIALALEYKSHLIILDDAKARKAAQKLNLNVTGTLGLLLKAKQMKIIPAIKPIIDKIQKTNFRFSAIVLNEIILLAEE